MCRTKRIIGIGLLGMSAGILLSLLLQSAFWEIILFVASLLGGVFLLQN